MIARDALRRLLAAHPEGLIAVLRLDGHLAVLDAASTSLWLRAAAMERDGTGLVLGVVRGDYSAAHALIEENVADALATGALVPVVPSVASKVAARRQQIVKVAK